ncbi:hypothetical protein ACE41H_21340 [Paenibacillus enshidis]|uniref:Uncharacterized protein n=1 Tax=Paenibacillus enshidis TaxID=1458439 RepID=A0ABV5AYM9_9BACL
MGKSALPCCRHPSRSSARSNKSETTNIQVAAINATGLLYPGRQLADVLQPCNERRTNPDACCGADTTELESWRYVLAMGCRACGAGTGYSGTNLRMAAAELKATIWQTQTFYRELRKRASTEAAGGRSVAIHAGVVIGAGKHRESGRRTRISGSVSCGGS